MKIDATKGWTEIIIVENCSMEVLNKIAVYIQTNLNISFTEQLCDLDSCYWDFIYKEAELTLHYNKYVGVSIFPKALANATSRTSQIIMEIANTLSSDLIKFGDSNNFVAKYFTPEPIQWGLRGDPHLWRDMKQKTILTEIPATVTELKKLLHKLFNELVGEAPQKDKSIFVKKYEVIGMSKGMISCNFWLEKGFPLIIQRYLGNDKP